MYTMEKFHDLRNSFFPHFAFVFALLLLMSCGDSKKTKTAGSENTASAKWELLLVTNKEWLKTNDGETLRNLVNREIPSLPQVEPMFRVTTINHSALEGTFKAYANILVVEFGNKFAETKVTRARDVYARGQNVVSVQAPNSTSLNDLLEREGDRILDLLVNEELTRLVSYVKKHHSGIVMQNASKMFGCEFFAPKDINSIKKGKDFFWASEEGQHENHLNVCMYSYPYTAVDTFTPEFFRQKRDSVLGVNIEGVGEDEHMSTSSYAFVQRNIDLDGMFVQETRGLWEMTNAPMGGPFISYTMIDTINNRVLTAEGFVYAPEKKKRDFIRLLEASLKTIKLPGRADEKLTH